MTSEVDVHRVRASVFAREVEWRLAGDRLLWEDVTPGGDASRGIFALDQVESVRLTREPMRGGARHFCRLRTRDGATAFIGSLHYAGVLRGEDRSATYRRLVRALVSRVASDNPRARFLSGATPYVWWSVVLGLAALFGAMGALFMLAGREMFTTRLALGLALLALGAPNLFRWLMSNRPGTFDPADPPI
ncbi:MAG: hypothetical protein ACK4MV_15280 [Beijerinckiaceae bacterium]